MGARRDTRAASLAVRLPPIRLSGGLDPATSTRLTAVLTGWLATYPSPSTRDAYCRDLSRFVAWVAEQGVDPFAVDAEVFRGYLARCQTDGAGPATVQRRLSAVASFYRFAVAETHVESDPTLGPRPAQVAQRSTTEGLSTDEVGAIWDAACRRGARDASLVALLLFEGLKLHETLILDRDAVQLDDGVAVRLEREDCIVWRAIEARTAGVVADLVASITAGPLFVGRSGARSARLSRFGADFVLKGVGSAASLREPLTANRLRSTHIRQALHNGTDPEVVRAALGHRSRRTALRFSSDGHGGPLRCEDGPDS